MLLFIFYFLFYFLPFRHLFPKRWLPVTVTLDVPESLPSSLAQPPSGWAALSRHVAPSWLSWEAPSFFQCWGLTLVQHISYINTPTPCSPCPAPHLPFLGQLACPTGPHFRLDNHFLPLPKLLLTDNWTPSSLPFTSQKQFFRHQWVIVHLKTVWNLKMFPEP